MLSKLFKIEKRSGAQFGWILADGSSWFAQQQMLIAAFSILCLASCATTLRGQSDIEPSEIIAKWKNLELQRIVGHWTSRSSNPGSTHIPSLQIEEQMKVGETMYLANTLDIATNIDAVKGFNDSYRFELRGQERKNYVLQSLEPLSSRSGDVAKLDARLHESASRSKALNFLFGLPWSYLADCPGFKLKLIGATSASGNEAFEFEFECAPPPEEHSPSPTAARNRPIPIVKNGRGVMLDEAHSYVPVSFTFEAKFQPDESFSQFEIKNEFDFELDRDPVVVKRIERRVYKGEPDVTTRVHEYHLFGKSPPESEFRLPAFGLPEPEFALPNSRTPFIFIGLAVVGLVSFIVGRRLQTSRPGKGGLRR